MPSNFANRDGINNFLFIGHELIVAAVTEEILVILQRSLNCFGFTLIHINSLGFEPFMGEGQFNAELQIGGKDARGLFDEILSAEDVARLDGVLGIELRG